MEPLIRIAKFAFNNFGPLIVFYLVNHFYGLRIAVVAGVISGFLEVGYQLIRRKKITNLFKFTLLVTIVFGVLDLTMNSPVFFKYESVITNIITGVFFSLTIWAPKSVIQEFMEKRRGIEITDPNAVLRCRIITVIWALYFFIKAGFYVYVSSRYSIERAMIIRSTLGTGSFYALLGLSLVFGKKVISYFQKIGMLPSYPETTTP